MCSSLTQDEFQEQAACWEELCHVFQAENDPQRDDCGLFGSPWGWKLKEAVVGGKKHQYLAAFIKDVAILSQCITPVGLCSNGKTSHEDNYDLSQYEDQSCTIDDSVMFHNSPSPINTDDNSLIECKTRICGWFHVLLHPVYQVPCPYIKLGMSLTSGQFDENQVLMDNCLDVSVMESLLLANTSKSGKISKENSKFESDLLLPPQASARQLIEEEHPLLGIPAACLHICGIPECLKLLQKQSQQQLRHSLPEDVSLQEICKVNKKLYLLQWFSVVGPYLGMSLSPTVHKRAVQHILPSL